MTQPPGTPTGPTGISPQHSSGPPQRTSPLSPTQANKYSQIIDSKKSKGMRCVKLLSGLGGALTGLGAMMSLTGIGAVAGVPLMILGCLIGGGAITTAAARKDMSAQAALKVFAFSAITGALTIPALLPFISGFSVGSVLLSGISSTAAAYTGKLAWKKPIHKMTDEQLYSVLTREERDLLEQAHKIAGIIQ